MYAYSTRVQLSCPMHTCNNMNVLILARLVHAREYVSKYYLVVKASAW